MRYGQRWFAFKLARDFDPILSRVMGAQYTQASVDKSAVCGIFSPSSDGDSAGHADMGHTRLC